MAEGYWHSFHGRTEESLKAFERAAGLVKNSLCLNFHTIAVMRALVGALRLRSDALESKNTRLSEQLRRRALRLARWTTRVARFFPTGYSYALRERSLILAACGATRKALTFADKRCAVALSQKARYEHAQSLLVRGKLAQQLGLPEAAEQIRTAEAALDVLERPIRDLDNRQSVNPPNLPKPSLPLQESVAKAEPSAAAGLKPRRRLGLTLVGGLLALGTTTLLGDVARRCTGYVAGFVGGAITGNLPAWKDAGIHFGIPIGSVTFPLLLLVARMLLRWGHRHHKAALATNRWRFLE